MTAKIHSSTILHNLFCARGGACALWILQKGLLRRSQDFSMFSPFHVYLVAYFVLSLFSCQRLKSSCSKASLHKLMFRRYYRAVHIEGKLTNSFCANFSVAQAKICIFLSLMWSRVVERLVSATGKFWPKQEYYRLQSFYFGLFQRSILYKKHCEYGSIILKCLICTNYSDRRFCLPWLFWQNLSVILWN